MRHEAVARREASTLEYVVDYQQHCEYVDHRRHEGPSFSAPRYPGGELVAESEQHVHYHAHGKAQGHVPASVRAIGDESVYELGYAIDYANQRKDYAEASVRYAIFFAKHRHGEGKVLAHEIEH